MHIVWTRMDLFAKCIYKGKAYRKLSLQTLSHIHTHIYNAVMKYGTEMKIIYIFHYKIKNNVGNKK